MTGASTCRHYTTIRTSPSATPSGVTPRTHLEGVEAVRRVSAFRINPGTGGRLGLPATATAGESGTSTPSSLRQRLIIRCAASEYRAPWTAIREAAASISRRSSAASSTAAAATFSCKRCGFVVPGIGTIH